MLLASSLSSGPGSGTSSCGTNMAAGGHLVDDVHIMVCATQTEVYCTQTPSLIERVSSQPRQSTLTTHS